MTSDIRQTLRLAMQLHEAATEAGANDYLGMARLLDECGFALAEPVSDGDQESLEERARLALALWRSLRACLEAVRMPAMHRLHAH
jgi:hypothetical protein